MSATSPVEAMVNAFTSYAAATLPALITRANLGQTLAAPPLKKIEKTARIDLQYFPSAAINLDSVETEATGPHLRAFTVMIDLFIFASDSKHDRLVAFVDRYLDAAMDLEDYDSTMGATNYRLLAERADKGIEPDGSRGWVAVSFRVWGEVNFG